MVNQWVNGTSVEPLILHLVLFAIDPMLPQVSP